MDNKDYCPLHCHDQYSILDGVGAAEEWANRAKELGFQSLALTNHMNADGLIQFQKACQEVSIKSILGCEMNIVPDFLVKEKGDKRRHLTVLVKNYMGWKNLLKLLTIANLQGFYYQPRTDPDTLLDLCEGLIILTGCSNSFLRAEYGEELLAALLGRTDVFLEVMPVQLNEQKYVNQLCLQMRDKYDIPLVATNDCHYPLNGQAELQEVLLAIQMKKRWTDDDRFKFSMTDLYLKSADEMIESFENHNSLSRQDYMEAIETTAIVAEMCDFHLEQKEPSLPRAHVPDYKDSPEDEQLINLALDGLHRRAEDHEWIANDIEKYEDRINEELESIMPQFTRYFLIVWELIDWCEKNDILVGPGRGCFLPGNKVLYSDGKTRYIEQVSTGDEIINHLGDKDTVTNRFRYRIDEPIVKIKTNTGKEISCTLDHRILTPSGWTKAKDLSNGNTILSVIQEDPWSEKNDESKKAQKPWCARENNIKADDKKASYHRRGQVDEDKLKSSSQLCVQAMPEREPITSEEISPEKSQSCLGTNMQHLYNESCDKYRRVEEKEFRFSTHSTEQAESEIKKFIRPISCSQEGQNAGLEKRESSTEQNTGTESTDKRYVLEETQREKRIRSRLCREIQTKWICLWLDKQHPIRLLTRVILHTFLPKKQHEHQKSIIQNKNEQEQNIQSRLPSRRKNGSRNKREMERITTYGRKGQSSYRISDPSRDQLCDISQERSGGDRSNGDGLGSLQRSEDKVQHESCNTEVVQEISTIHYKGEVYDIQVSDQSSYNIEGIGVHNSSSGSLVSYCLRITNIDPIKYKLIFSRFISPGRIDLPDIDMDFEDRKRPLILKHLQEIYGEWNVVEVSNFLKMHGRGSVRSVSRVFNLPMMEVDRAAKCIVTRSSGDFRSSFTIEDAFDTFEDGIYFRDKYPKVTQMAMDLEGQVSATGRHAAGICVSKDDLRSGENASLLIRKDHLVCNWDKEDAEYTGLMKLDILGLNALTILAESRKLINERHNTDINFNLIDIDDPRIYEELSLGNNIGVFQFNSLSMIKLCKEIKAEGFDGMVALNALHRPGALRCVTGDTLIKVPKGSVRIDSLDRMHPVISEALPEHNKHFYVKNYVNQVIPTGRKNVFIVRDSLKNKIKCTAEHRFWVKKKGWRRLDRVTKGDEILTVSKHSKVFKERISGILKKYGSKTRFKKGSTPWNEGIPQSEFNPYISYKMKHDIENSPVFSAEAKKKWHKAMFGDKDKWALTVEKMRRTNMALWESEGKRKKHSDIMKEYYKHNTHPNETMSNTSKPQIELFNAIKEWFPEAILNHKVVVGNRIFFPDIALLDQKIDIEYDGEYWHENPGEREEPRDSLLEADGWTVIRLTVDTYKNFIKNLNGTPIKNSLKYSTIKSIKYIGKHRTYDLNLVNTEFPNYIAEGFVVHNSGMTQVFKKRKDGVEPVEYAHPWLEGITKDTYGLILYQEQVMRLMYELGGLPWKTADTIRKVISKSKGVEEFMKFKDAFIEGCERLGTLSAAEAEPIFEELKDMGSYSFNLSHAAAYSLIAAWEMWLKIHYPIEFMTASLSYGPDKKKEELISEAKRLKIKIVLPDINLSQAKRWVIGENGELIAPFTEIKGVGEVASEKIAEEREANGPYESPEDLESRVPKRQVNIRVRKLLEKVKAYESPESKTELPEEELEELSKLFDFELSNDPLYKYRKCIKYLSNYIEMSKIEDSHSYSQKEKRFYFGRIEEMRVSYKSSISDEGKKGKLGFFKGIYGQLRDETDIKMIIFATNVYNEKKYQIEHCKGEAMFTWALNARDKISLIAENAWIGEDILSGKLNGSGIELVESVDLTSQMLEIGNDIENCDTCGLIDECTRPVLPSAGLFNMMLIGEAPGRSEDREGIGFIGDSGKTLFRELGKRGLERDLFHITNVCKCYPSKTRTPKKAHVDRCGQFLDREIKLVKPFIILAMGNTCNLFFRGEAKGIMALNGQTIWNDKYNCWITYSVHPAMVSYDASNLPLLEESLDAFADRVQWLGFGG